MSERRCALITGITGQDGSYLAELLLEKGYEVHGMVRRASTEKFERIEHLRDRVTLHQADLLDQRSLVDAIRAARPRRSTTSPRCPSWPSRGCSRRSPRSSQVSGVTRMLEAMRDSCPEARFYQASTSEMFGKVQRGAADGDARLPPALALRRGQGLRALHHGQLSRELRPARQLRHPVQPRVPAPRARVRHPQDHRAVAAIRLGLDRSSPSGNLDAKRDWGFAGDYVEAMWLMLQQPEADDYVIATGETHSDPRVPRHRVRPGRHRRLDPAR